MSDEHDHITPDPFVEGRAVLRLRTSIVDHGDHKHVMYNAYDAFTYFRAFFDHEVTRDTVFLTSDLLEGIVDALQLPDQYADEIRLATTSRLLEAEGDEPDFSA